MAELSDSELQNKLRERAMELPQVLRDAVTSEETAKHLRTLAETHNLHIDQWGTLENEVMLILMGFESADYLGENLQKELGLSAEDALALAEEISQKIFLPIRAELEKASPQTDLATDAAAAAAKVPEPTPVFPPVAEAVPTSTASTTEVTPPVLVTTPRAAPVMPATPPSAAPEKKVERAATSPNYAGQTPSHARAAIEGDPYREQVA